MIRTQCFVDVKVMYHDLEKFSSFRVEIQKQRWQALPGNGGGYVTWKFGQIINHLAQCSTLQHDPEQCLLLGALSFYFPCANEREREREFAYASRAVEVQQRLDAR
jgi:hypothetical protein